MSRTTLLTVSRKHWIFSRWLLAAALMQWTSGNYFIIGAGSILGPASAGALKASQNIMGISHIIFQGMENIVPARASYCYHQGGWAKLFTYLKKVTGWGGAFTAIIVLLAIVFPSFWMGTLYGSEYEAYSYVLQWYGGIYILIFLGLPLRAGLRAMEYSKPIFISYCLMTVFTAATANFFIRKFGLTGATAGIFATQMICQTNLAYALWRKKDK
ncbi:lipopolysaccharide biosynthesis protein [Desulfomarina profundi]|uniref:lipopolysaccharide biosynthesis protein n=1 Tax=Desulfomarina profundi TaxID=2772557 RepID=UPI001E60C3A8|nr:hypothetical protein [Desulfomarina profundi]